MIGHPGKEMLAKKSDTAMDEEVKQEGTVVAKHGCKQDVARSRDRLGRRERVKDRSFSFSRQKQLGSDLTFNHFKIMIL